MIVGNEPNVNRFWQPQFAPDGATRPRPGLPRASGRTSTTRSRRPSPTVLVWGGALGPRGSDRPQGSRPHPLARRLHPRNGKRPSARAGGRSRSSTASPSTPIPRPRGRRPTSATRTRARARSASPTSAGSRACCGRRSGASCRSSTASSGSRAPSRPRRAALRGDGARRSRRRGDTGGLLPPRARARRLSAERRRAAVLPLARRAEPGRLPVGRVLRRRHAEGEPARRTRGNRIGPAGCVR